MISRQLLKEVIATNIAYILEKVRPVVPRERFARRAVERYTITNAPLLERLSETLFSSCSRKVLLSALLR
jgi:hypothetical protein